MFEESVSPVCSFLDVCLSFVRLDVPSITYLHPMQACYAAHFLFCEMMRSVFSKECFIVYFAVCIRSIFMFFFLLLEIEALVSVVFCV